MEVRRKTDGLCAGKDNHDGFKSTSFLKIQPRMNANGRESNFHPKDSIKIRLATNCLHTRVVRTTLVI